MGEESKQQLLERIQQLENRLEESEQLIEAIKAGEVDAFAINDAGKPEIYTLQSGDYAYRVLIEEFGEGAINITEDGLIVYCNPYFFDLLKLPYQAVIGSFISDFIHRDSLAVFNRIFEQGLTGKSKGEINLFVQGTIIPVYVSLTSLQPRLPTIGLIITDLTQKKKNEETILQYQMDLERNNQALIHSNAELASFAYVASHDLQEPLRKIQIFSTRILEKEAELLSDSAKDSFQRMQNAVKRMKTLIEDLLTYSRTNTTERTYEPTNLLGLVEEVKEDLKEELQQKHALIEINEMCDAHIIPFQFRQLLHNLISNALKFSKPEVTPHIKIKSENAKGVLFNNEKLSDEINYCHISISDNGIGFEPQYSKKIFELFQRLHGNARYKGTGIGLAIVKKIVENHNGIITASSELNEGATFDIYIPA